MWKFHKTHVGIGGDCVCILWFLQPICVWSLLYFLCPLQGLCHALSLELIITPLLGDDFSHLRPLPAARPGCPVPPVVEGWHSEDSLYYSIQWVESKDEATWELIRGLDILVHPSPPSGSLSSTNLLYREDFLRSVLTGLAWVQMGRWVCVTG